MLRDRGFEVYDVRDHGLRGQEDSKILAFAKRHEAILITGDVGFGNLLLYPVGSHAGIVIVRFPNEISPPELNINIAHALDELSDDELPGSLTILEPGKIRIRKK